MAFCFFVGTLGAFMATAVPAYGFEGYSLLLPRMLGFYGTHCLLVIEALALVTFGLYKPELKDLPGTVVMLFLIAFILYALSMLLRFTGICPRANYFYTVEPEGNAALELFYRWIPCQYLYLLPCAVALVPYMLAVLGIIRLVEKVSH